MSRNFWIRERTPDFRKIPTAVCAVRRRYRMAYSTHWGRGWPVRCCITISGTPNTFLPSNCRDLLRFMKRGTLQVHWERLAGEHFSMIAVNLKSESCRNGKSWQTDSPQTCKSFILILGLWLFWKLCQRSFLCLRSLYTKAKQKTSNDFFILFF